MSDAFAPAGVVYLPMSKNLVKARFTVLAIALAVPVIGLAVLSIFVPWFALGFIPILLLVIWLGWLIPRQVGYMGYAQMEADLLFRSGYMFKTLTVVPYGRMQYVQVQEGPIARHFGLASVQIHTAALTVSAVLPGIPQAEAAQLRQTLTELGEAQMAGL